MARSPARPAPPSRSTRRCRQGSGPVYFYHNSVAGLIWPDPTLTETATTAACSTSTSPRGRYVLTAHKEGVSFQQRTMWCRAGWLVNASPPYGLQAY